LAGVLVLPPDELGWEDCEGCVAVPLEPVDGTVGPVVWLVSTSGAGSPSGRPVVTDNDPTAIGRGAAARRSMPAGGACGLGGLHVGETSQTTAAA
jgi:hypothetical protein